MISEKYIMKTTNRFYNHSFIVVLVISGIFAFVHRFFANEFGLNFFEYLIEILTSQKMILYLIFIFYLFAITKIVTEVSVQELIRFQNFSRYSINFLISIALIASSYILVLLLLYSVSGIGLPFENVFGNTVFFFPDLAKIHYSPFVVLLVSSFHIVLFLVTVTMMLKVVYSLFNFKAYIATAISIVSLILISIGREGVHWTFEFEAYLTSFNAVYNLQDKFYLYYLIEVMIIVSCYLLLKFKWSRKNGGK